MDVLQSLYPALQERQSLPLLYTPTCFCLCLIPFLTKHRFIAILVTFPSLLYFCFRWPNFTTGDPSSDYYNGSLFVALPLWYLDFVLLTPRSGKDAPKFVGPSKTPSRTDNEINPSPLQGRRWVDCTTSWDRLRWSVRLMIPAQRGIGWNWQVKGVHSDTTNDLLKWRYVRHKLQRALFFYLQSIVALVTVGIGCALKEKVESSQYVKSALVDGLVGLSGATWVWDRLECSYSLAAALAVGMGLTGAWEWPLLMGPLSSAWSVRQMWGTTYHQSCRRILSQPSKHIVRLLRLRKGSLPSAYCQLFVSFGISCLFHQAQMFNVTRRDQGEFAFFMLQPCAVAVEDLLSWFWKHIAPLLGLKHFGRPLGYVWVFLWFAFSTHGYIYGLAEANVMQDWIMGYLPFEMGAKLVGF